VNIEVSKIAVHATAAMMGSSGILTVILKAFDHHAAGIGAISTIVFGIIYVIFQYLQNKKLTLADQNKEDLEELNQKLDEHMEETREESKRTNTTLNLILEKLE